jgi:hypothetical protein
VKLVDVYVIDFEPFETELEIFFKFLSLPRLSLGGDHQFLSLAGDGFADAFLAGGITVGGIEEGDAMLEAALDYRYGLIIGKSLNRDTPETDSGHHKFSST